MLIGRGAERDRLRRALDAAQRGRAEALLLHGEPGIGKTALLEDTVEAAGRRGYSLLRARGHESESGLPYAGMSELIAPVLDRRSVLPEVQEQALAGALALAGGEPPDRFAVAAAVLSLLDAAADASPLLVIVDDVQWLDDASRDALLFAARRLQAENVLLLLASRDGVGFEPEATGLETLGVGPLAPKDAEELLHLRHPTGIAPAVARRLLATAQGNPLALAELPSLLTPDQLAGRTPVPDPLPSGATVERAFRRQLTALPDDARRALLLCAADEHATLADLEIAFGVLDLPETVLESAEAVGLVRVEGGRVEFRHPVLRSVVYHSVSPPERRHAHRALAEALGDSPTAAWHAAQAVRSADEAVAARLAEVATDAGRRGAPASAMRGLALAAAITPSAALRAERLQAAAANALLAGRTEEAAGLVDQGLAIADEPGRTSELRRLRAGVLLRQGQPQEALALLEQESSAAAASEPARAARLLLEGATVHLIRGDMRALLDLAERASALARGVDDEAELIARLVVAVVQMARGETALGEPVIAELEPTLMIVPLSPAATEAVTMAARASIWVSEVDRAGRLLDRVISEARAANALGVLAYPLASRAHLDFRLGRWADALATAEAAVETAQLSEQSSMLAHCLAALSLVQAGLGQRDAARESGLRALDVARRFDARVPMIDAHYALGVEALGAGRPQDAIDELSQNVALAVATDIFEPGLTQWHADHVEAHVRAGQPDGARRAQEALEQAAAQTGRPWALAVAARCRGLLAPDASFETELRHALELHQAVPQPFEQARTELVLGERLRRARRLADAREPLRTALATFERLGARDWAARARDELRTSGATTGDAPASRRGFDELTAHELRIALLAARGRSNPEIAADLVLSRKTIEYHLGQVYRKLGLRSRTELAAHLAGVESGRPAPLSTATS